ncbi:MAG: sulfate adenylyltransferase [Candidatus Abyssobacteria bacterium SURF_5]|uniref:Sulfate adenylyltransferase n=1 Tax=Abyssobacteria bacterium (strain SURF_5) TaxID=2093360 RepID=A0A3A4ND52_ABYX5|nr:MAG: sulfate adenylyltransferase [Candidatus Abyssubacteria bacterium SURF_5]
MSKLVKPHGAAELKPLLLSGKKLEEAKKKAQSLPKIVMTSRETSDLIMMGIGAFTPLEGFMTKADWKGVCAEYIMANGVFWPIPITLSASKEVAGSLKEGSEAALVDGETNELMGSIKITEKYTIDKEYECKQVFRTNDKEHPGVAKVMQQAETNLAGPVHVFSESYYPKEFKDVYMRPAESRKIFEQKGWNTVAALQLRNPMHRSHEYLAKIAVEVCDGLFIHQLVGKLKAGDIPADVRVKCIDVLVENYFVKDTVVQGGYPMEMRYGGPREALLHAVFRQNYGCSHLIVGRDHAGVGDYYGPFDAQKIFNEIPKDALELKPLNIDWTFYCHKCRGMASMRTCPHGKEDRLLLSGTMLRKMLSEGGEVPADFSRPEVLTVLKEYYAGLTEKVEIKLHGAATGEAAKKK